MTLRRGWLKETCFAAALLASCGGTSPPAEAPTAPEPSGRECNGPACDEQEDRDAALPGGAVPPSGYQSPAAPAEEAPTSLAPATKRDVSDAEFEEASADWEQALQALSDGSRDGCTRACRALSSLMRAAEHICENDSGQRCRSARAQAKNARKQVVAHCGPCPAPSD
jgi:hypothetical protein